ncbi:spermine/spermidine synthase [Tenacibaculum adriaticum]|uniref:Spermine/spermidine synthase n=1 Tax=Tenacibaculum adriaticum TaxID=413713 RepID=A0A5S5DSV2_9FLAO|nr:fused MFS/spermidine synthase [Tenacibaculum adriaticum]TYP98086.1 spermine/spermidine synthase [Tenacibaculum adriaticum]
MKRILSYIWPQTTKVNSDYNGILEVTFINGRKILDSKNANYSFGSLQQILEIGISKIDLKNVDSILLLGLGGGSIVSSLRNKFGFNKKIIAVELDQKVIDIAQKEFFISSSDTLVIKKYDAFNFVKNSNNQYDLIIVDLFIDNQVPKQFYTEEFCNNLSNIITTKGSIIFNLGINQINKDKRNSVINYFYNKKEYKTFQYEKILGTNSLLIANKTTNKKSL